MKAIDLGLSSGLKWADCNIGAEKESDYGLYFQWGDTVGYPDASHSTWETCPGNGGSKCFDLTSTSKWDGANLNHRGWDMRDLNNGVLMPEVDAAYAHLGSEWRMPTIYEMVELYENTTNEVVEINGVIGMKFINKEDASKYIFFPFAGYADEGRFYCRGLEGFWWSSSDFIVSDGSAYGLLAVEAGAGSSVGERRIAFSVRRVKNT